MRLNTGGRSQGRQIKPIIELPQPHERFGLENKQQRVHQEKHELDTSTLAAPEFMGVLDPMDKRIESSQTEEDQDPDDHSP